MFKKILKKIESKRESKNLFWKFSVFLKDLCWKFYMSLIILEIRLKYFFNFNLSQGKLPDFIIIGVQKGGTSSLYANLKQHPDIEMCPNLAVTYLNGTRNTKEAHFFDNNQNWARGIGWYKSLFNNSGKLQGDATPNYICEVKSQRRMFSVAPQAKLILILRDPVTRAHSNFNHMKSELPFTKDWCYLPYGTFEENIFKEIENKFKGPGVINRGFYIDQIEPLLKFYPRNKILILISERMKQDMQGTYKKIFDFLEVKMVNLEFIQDVNKRKYDGPMSKQAEKRLYEIYKPYNERLFKFLGYKIPEWIH
jgi:hypothetical protein